MQIIRNYYYCETIDFMKLSRIYIQQLNIVLNNNNVEFECLSYINSNFTLIILIQFQKRLYKEQAINITNVKNLYLQNKYYNQNVTNFNQEF